MVMMLKIFSALVVADTFPNPTLVKLEHVKYNDVMYASECVTLFTFTCRRSASVFIQPVQTKTVVIHPLFTNDVRTREKTLLKTYLNTHTHTRPYLSERTFEIRYSKTFKIQIKYV